ncbi:MAG: phosphoribosyltransferase family protein [bacterium]|nr:phosphoribosyltransferase family protein [bacterium]
MINFNQTSFCSICRARLPQNKKICHKDAPYILAAATNYNSAAIRNLICQYKYRRRQTLVNPLANIVNTFIDKSGLKSIISTDTLIIPIPLHPKKQRERGFNQSLLLAQSLSTTLKLPVENILERKKPTTPQAEINDFEKRKINVADCFAINETARITNKIKNKDIVLIDDVYTSGSTLNEAAKMLKICGAKKIIALVIAKA